MRFSTAMVFRERRILVVAKTGPRHSARLGLDIGFTARARQN
jgi:hypothetical protein